MFSRHPAWLDSLFSAPRAVHAALAVLVLDTCKVGAFALLQQLACLGVPMLAIGGARLGVTVLVPHAMNIGSLLTLRSFQRLGLCASTPDFACLDLSSISHSSAQSGSSLSAGRLQLGLVAPALDSVDVCAPSVRSFSRSGAAPSALDSSSFEAFSSAQTSM